MGQKLWLHIGLQLPEGILVYKGSSRLRIFPEGHGAPGHSPQTGDPQKQGDPLRKQAAVHAVPHKGPVRLHEPAHLIGTQDHIRLPESGGRGQEMAQILGRLRNQGLFPVHQRADALGIDEKIP